MKFLALALLLTNSSTILADTPIMELSTFEVQQNEDKKTITQEIKEFQKKTLRERCSNERNSELDEESVISRKRFVTSKSSGSAARSWSLRTTNYYSIATSGNCLVKEN